MFSFFIRVVLFFIRIFLFIISSCNDNDELPLYSSFEESEEAVPECVLCGSSEDIPLELGKMVTMDDVTVHHFCLVSEMIEKIVLVLFCFHSKYQYKYCMRRFDCNLNNLTLFHLLIDPQLKFKAR